MPSLPTPIRAYVGLLASAVEQAVHLIERGPELPVQVVGNTMQLSMRAQQRYTELVARGDEVLGHLRPTPAQPPSWATFDEDSTPPPADVLDFDEPAGDVPAGVVVAMFDDDPAVDDVVIGAGARLEPDDYPTLAAESGTPLATHGDPLVAGTDGVIALPAKTRAPRKRAPRPVKAAAPVVVEPADLPAIPEAVLSGTARRDAAAGPDAARARTSAPGASAAPAVDGHVPLSTFETPPVVGE